MFNLLPGQGLGFTGAKEIAFGLGAMSIDEVPLPSAFHSPYNNLAPTVTIMDNEYSKIKDDNEVVEILLILLHQVID